VRRVLLRSTAGDVEIRPGMIAHSPDGAERVGSITKCATERLTILTVGIVREPVREDLERDLALQLPFARVIQLAHTAATERLRMRYWEIVWPINSCIHFPDGTRRFNSSNQFSTTSIGAETCSPSLTIRKRWPSRDTS
jgi:hypothetical protein